MNAPLPSSVSVTLEREQDNQLTIFRTPDESSYWFHCDLEGGRYTVRVNCGPDAEEQVVSLSVPLPRRFMQEHAPLKVIRTQPEKPWRLAIDRQRRIHFTIYHGSSFSSIGRGDENPSPRVKCKNMLFPRGIAVDTSDNKVLAVYITGNHKLQKYVNGKFEVEIGHNEPGANFNQFHDPNGVCFHKRKVYVCDSVNYRIQVFSPDLKREDTRVIGRFTNSSPTFKATVLFHPEDLDFDSHDNLYVVDSGYRIVLVFKSADDYASVLRTIPLEAAVLPVSLRIFRDAADRSYFCVSDHDGCGIAVYSIDGGFVRKVGISCGKTGRGSLRVLVEGGRKSVSYVPPESSVYQARPLGLAVDCDGFLYVACSNCNEIHVFE